MKKLSELKAGDFHGIANEKFEEWKQAQIDARRNMLFAQGGIIIFWVLILLFAAGFIPIILGIIITGVAGTAVNWKANRLSRELGITKDMIRKARMTKPLN